MPRFGAGAAGDHYRQGLGAAREVGVVRNGQCQRHQLHQRTGKTLQCAVRQVEHGLQHQQRLNGDVGVFKRRTALAGGGGTPVLAQKLVIKPSGHGMPPFVASLDTTRTGKIDNLCTNAKRRCQSSPALRQGAP